MPLLVEPDTTTAGVLAAVLPAGSQVVPRGEEAHQWLSGRGDYALVLGPTLDLATATGLAEAVRLTHPATAVVLLRHDLAPEVYAQAMASGIGAVVAADDHAGLGAALARAKQAYEALHGGPAADREGRVFTVFSPKGGVGKTTMSVNLALALTHQGAQVCVLDLDLAFGDVAITLQLIPSHTIADAADSEADLDDALLQSLLTRHSSGLSILAAPTHPEGRDRIPASLVRRVVQILRARFDYVVIDTPPGFDDQVLGAFDETDECVVVATLDVPTVKNTKVALETLDLLHLVRDHRHLVLNRADDEVGLSLAHVEDILSTKVAAALPSSLAVASATNHGDPIVASKPDHPVSLAITGLARDLMGTGADLATAPAKRGLFGRSRKKVAR
ncbi:MAG: MinD/ParA family protein [Marmoricola sp.]|nr:MinD/ParA family protein [Marmoricola sp.]